MAVTSPSARIKMVDFLPFEGLRPNLKAGEHIGDRISPPYDVIGPDYLKELQSKPHNITRLTLNPDADKRYTTSSRGTSRPSTSTSRPSTTTASSASAGGSSGS